MLKVKDFDDLVRDPVTGAILTNNRTELQKAKSIKARLLEKDNQISDLTKRLERLELILLDKE